MIRNATGSTVWDPNKYGFIEEGKDRPDTVNPSLWRQSQLANISALFKVVDRIYQVRNCDLSNMTIIEGDTGIIVVDPLISGRHGAHAPQITFQHRPKRNVVAVIYSHSHVDHFGGVRGSCRPTMCVRKIAIYAPEAFFEHAISENVMAGNVMGRRGATCTGTCSLRSRAGRSVRGWA